MRDSRDVGGWNYMRVSSEAFVPNGSIRVLRYPEYPHSEIKKIKKIKKTTIRSNKKGQYGK